MKYPRISAERKTGKEKILDSLGQPVSCLEGFWQWAYSDLISNAERGALAEYIVACALGVTDQGRIEWDKYDLKTKDGISIEIKTSGYIQTWGQSKVTLNSYWKRLKNQRQRCKKQNSARQGAILLTHIFAPHTSRPHNAFCQRLVFPHGPLSLVCKRAESDG